jgi:hypothetical protein
MFGGRASGETERMSEREITQPTSRHAASTSRATRRGADYRKTAVRPQDDPAPSSPAPDREAVAKGKDILERVKAY